MSLQEPRTSTISFTFAWARPYTIRLLRDRPILSAILILFSYITQLDHLTLILPIILINSPEIPKPNVTIFTASEAYVIFDLNTLHSTAVSLQPANFSAREKVPNTRLCVFLRGAD